MRYYILVLPLLVSCVTFVRPRGEWATPVDVPLDKSRLEETSISFQCGYADRDSEKWTAANYEACQSITRMLKKADVDVLTAADEAVEEESPAGPAKPDFTLIYIDRGTERDYCGWTLPFFILFFGFFPCVEDGDILAEVRILDSNGSHFKTYPLKSAVKSIYGVPALYYRLVALSAPDRKIRREARLADNLFQYVQNIIFTYNERTKLADGEL